MWQIILRFTVAMVCCYHLNSPLFGVSALEVNYSDTWEMSGVKGLHRGSSIRLKKLEFGNLYSTCYQATCLGNQCPSPSDPQSSIQFCYPSVIVIGIPRCGTLAMYDLILRLPWAIGHGKRICPYNKHRPHWQYLNSLPKLSVVRNDSIIVDGCLDVKAQMQFREFLRQPRTLYIVGGCFIV